MEGNKCPVCGYNTGDSFYFRCPRCHEILIKKCSECKNCKLNQKCSLSHKNKKSNH